MRQTKTLFLLLITVAVFVIGIAYAAISAISFNVTGNATATPSADNFKVVFGKVGTADAPTFEPGTGGSSSINVAFTTPSDRRATMEVRGLKKVGDSVTATFTVINESTDLMATITHLTATGSNQYYSVVAELVDKILLPKQKTNILVKVTLIKSPINSDELTNITIDFSGVPTELANADGGEGGGAGGQGNVPGLILSNTTFTLNPSTPTNGTVKVGISTTLTGYTLQYSTDGNNWNNYTGEITVSDNGLIYARVINSSGGGYTTINVTNIDRLAPKAFSATATNVTTNSVTITGSTEDADATAVNGSSEFLKYYYYISENGTTWSEKSGGIRATSYTFTGLDQGKTYYFKMKAVDDAKNETETSAITKTVESVPGLTLNNTTFTYSPSTPINGTVKVGISTIVTGYTLQYSTDSYIWNNYTGQITIYDNGPIYARVVDTTGQSTGYAAGNVTNIDRLAPKAFSASVTNVTTNSVTIAGNTTDAEATSVDASSGIAKYYYYISTNNIIFTEKSGGITGTSYTFTGLDQGQTYYLKMKAVDNANNETETLVIKQVLANVPGLTLNNTTITYNPSTPTNGTVKVGITTTVTGYTLQYSTDGSNWNNYTDQIPVNNNGPIYARVVDSRGQSTGYATGNVVNIDRLAPTISDIATKITSGSIKVVVAASDNYSGIATYYYSIDNGATYTESTSASYTFTGLSPVTTYNIKVKVKDAVGNEAEQLIQITTSKAVTVGETVTYKGINWKVTGIADGTVTMTVSAPVGSYTHIVAEGSGSGEADLEGAKEREIEDLHAHCNDLFGDDAKGITAESVSEYQGWTGVRYYIAKAGGEGNSGNVACTYYYRTWLYYVNGENSTTYNGIEGSYTYAIWPIVHAPSNVIIGNSDGTFVIE